MSFNAVCSVEPPKKKGSPRMLGGAAPSSTASSSYRIDPSRGDGFSASALRTATPLQRVKTFYLLAARKAQNVIDRLNPYPLYRWLISLLLTIVFMLRVILLRGFYVVAYALGIFLLSSFLLFLSPKFDPALELDNDADLDVDDDQSGPALPTSLSPATPSSSSIGVAGDDAEFRPFVRRLPEFVFWYSTFKALCIALLATIFPFLDIPVFWPILLIYFIILTVVTLKKQIRHMMKYKYIPFDFGKKAYSTHS